MVLAHYPGSLSVPDKTFGTIEDARLPTSIAGSFVQGSVGSFAVLNIGDFDADNVTTGTLDTDRFADYKGTVLGGSFSGREVRTGYVVWDSPFPDGTYVVSHDFEFGTAVDPDSGEDHWMLGWTHKLPGSAEWYLQRDPGPSTAGTVDPPELINFLAIHSTNT